MRERMVSVLIIRTGIIEAVLIMSSNLHNKNNIMITVLFMSSSLHNKDCNHDSIIKKTGTIRTGRPWS